MSQENAPLSLSVNEYAPGKQFADLVLNTRALNAQGLFTLDFVHTLQNAIYALEDNYHGIPLVIRSGPEGWGEGLDLAHFWEGDPNTQGFHKFEKMIATLENMHRLTIAVIEGTCLGGALELAMACDIRLALPNAELGFNQGSHGMIPGMGTWRLAKYCGLSTARLLTLTGRRLNTMQALEHHLITEVLRVDHPLIESYIYEYLRDCELPSQAAIIGTKRLLNESFAASYHDALGNYLACQERCLRVLQAEKDKNPPKV